MKKNITTLLGILVTIIMIIVFSCKEDNTITQPNQEVVNLSGKIETPFAISDISKMKVTFGQNEYSPNSDGEFTFSGNSNLPGVAILMDEDDNPCLMSIIPKPSEGHEFKVNVHSTALSLLFLCPFICTDNSEDAIERIADIENLQEFVQFENLLQSKLSSNASSLFTDDIELLSSFNNTVLAFLNNLSTDSSGVSLKKRSIRNDEIIIEPVSMVSGHNLEYVGEENFKIYNYYGRWAKCIIPGDDIYLPPNGDLVDVLLWRPLWKPSDRTFEMPIIAGEDAKEVNVYGLGYGLQESPSWDELTAEEQNNVLYAGMITVTIEFVPRIISVLTNTSVTFGKGIVASNRALNIIGTLFTYNKIIEKARKYVSEGDYSGFLWEMAKEHISLIVNDDEFRAKFLKEVGVALSNSALKTLASAAHISLKVLFIGDDLTGLAKSTIALYNSQLKTTFKVYSEDYSFGNVNGNVYDKESGSPIQGVNVKLLGDENNPMNPNYNYVTDASGGFWFENILTGKKTISVSKEEYGGKTIEIEVKDKETTEVTITLSKDKATITGRVVNEIFIKNNVTPINFNKECHLDIKEIGGNNQSYSFWIYEQNNGTYTQELSPGVYEIKAWHEDYEEASTTITLAGNTTFTVDDLLLKPKCSMTGYIYINQDPLNSSSYNIQREFNVTNFVGGGIYDDDDIYVGSRKYIAIKGFMGNPPSLNNFSTINISMIPGILPGDHQLGEEGNIADGSEKLAGVSFATDIPYCTYENNNSWIEFKFHEELYEETCNCGITNSGTLYLDEIGSELTDVIKGKIVCDLAGSEVCFCNYNDYDGDGEPEWFLDCVTARLEIEFKIISGTLYRAGGE